TSRASPRPATSVRPSRPSRTRSPPARTRPRCSWRPRSPAPTSPRRRTRSSALDALRRLLAHEPEEVARDASHLDLLGALGDAVPPVMAVDVLEGKVAGVAEAA